MKKIILLIVIFNICYLIFNIITANAAPFPTTTNAKPVKDQLIESIASRVAELKLVEKRGIIGVVSDTSNTQITVSDVQNNTRFIDVDELTKFSSPLAKGSFGISDITKGTSIGALGLYNKESRRLLARFVNVVDIPRFIHGAIDSTDNKNYTLNVTTDEGKKITVDVETSTKILSYTKGAGITRSGFSKTKENEDIIVIGFTDIKNRDKVIASRIILFPENLPSLQTTPNETIIPSAGSGKKLTPVTK